VARNAQRDLDGRNKSGLRQAAITKRPCGSQIDSSSSIPFDQKCKMEFACQSQVVSLRMRKLRQGLAISSLQVPMGYSVLFLSGLALWIPVAGDFIIVFVIV